jgi:hypothetical protein
VDWEASLAASQRRHDERSALEVAHGERLDLHLSGIASASWASGLAALMLGRVAQARELLRRAADEYVASWDVAPAASWGRPIASLKCRLIAGDHDGARRDGERVLAEGAPAAETAVGRYAWILALLVLGRDAEARDAAEGLADPSFPPDVAAALEALARSDADGYAAAVRDVLLSFEQRDAFLENAREADTVLALQALARDRGIEAALASPLLPG